MYEIEEGVLSEPLQKRIVLIEPDGVPADLRNLLPESGEAQNAPAEYGKPRNSRRLLAGIQQVEA